MTVEQGIALSVLRSIWPSGLTYVRHISFTKTKALFVPDDFYEWIGAEVRIHIYFILSLIEHDI